MFKIFLDIIEIIIPIALIIFLKYIDKHNIDWSFKKRFINIKIKVIHD
ncbi:hypothetical protein [Clostridium tagluense]|uniref:Uncharacterized protein n=1 Tax=Clostridium tagluense TaxID=360422 RepID=A0A401USX7_9CLOT|nr:hypothetical protein [Clostridium tagluense]GCD12614.1 hypothetical protein Ctaglu_42370 [Clostridium tagluense]